MACKGRKHNPMRMNAEGMSISRAMETSKVAPIKKLFFGVDSNVPATTILQNNLTEFEWVERNKLKPVFWGRNITGSNSLTIEEIRFLHSKGCGILPLHKTDGKTETESQGKIVAEEVITALFDLRIPYGTAIFLEIEEMDVDHKFMKGFAEKILSLGFIPGFKANTDAAFNFDREFSRGFQINPDIFNKCAVWATSPNLEEYNEVVTTHLIHPDDWMPYAPSCMTREDISIWQYGKRCHPINDESGIKTEFNVNLVDNNTKIIKLIF